MTHTTTPTTLAELRDSIAGGQVSTLSAAGAIAVLDLVESELPDAFRDPSVLVTDVAFASRFPEQPTSHIAAAFGNSGIYKRCRVNLFRHCKLAGLWSEDPFLLLNRLAHEIKAPPVNERLLTEHFPGVALRDVTRERVLPIDKALRGQRRNAFRNSLAALDRLRSLPQIRDLGILGPDVIGPLPSYRDGDKLPVALPAELDAARGRLSGDASKRARRAYELATDLDLFPAAEGGPAWNLTEAAARTYLEAVSALVSANSANLYLRALIALLRAYDPAAAPPDLTVDRVRQPERFRCIDVPTSMPVRTGDPGEALPARLEAEVVAYAEAKALSPKSQSTLRRILREYIRQRDNFDSDVALADARFRIHDVFPEVQASTRGTYGSVLRSFLRHTGRQDPWERLGDEAKALALPGVSTRGLRLLERLARAMDPELTPAGMDTRIAGILLETARRERYGPRLREGLRSLDILRPVLPDLLPGPAIGPAEDGRRRGNFALPPHLENALDGHAQEAGFAPAGRKAMLVAVRKLFALSRDRSRYDSNLADIPWAVLLEEGLIDHARELAPYRTELARLADRVTVQTTDGWQKLRCAVAAAGIRRSDNPIEAVEEVALQDHRDPWQLDRDWAWAHERGLRPDLRLTWARNIERLDALQDNPALAGSKLLPAERLGPMPARGARFKNAVYPLPRRFEAALCGESKQVLEAAHFVWRCLRDLALYGRGEDPDPQALVAEPHLARIADEQAVMSAQSARLHIARIRDWRESRALLG